LNYMNNINIKILPKIDLILTFFKVSIVTAEAAVIVIVLGPIQLLADTTMVAAVGHVVVAIVLLLLQLLIVLHQETSFPQEV